MANNNSIKFYNEMTDEEKKEITLKNKEKYFNKIQILFNMLNYSLHNYPSIFTEKELQQIKEASSLLEQIKASLSNNFEGDLNLEQFESDMTQYAKLEKSTRNISFKVLKQELTNPTEYHPDQRFVFVVHVPTEGTINDPNNEFKTTSASLITDRSMGLFDDHTFGKYGYILDVPEENYIVSSTADLFSILIPQIESEKENYFMELHKNDKYAVETDDLIFEMSETHIPIPHYIEQVNYKTNLDVNGEALNYDKEEIYNEVVLLNDDNCKKVAVFVRTVGDKNFNSDYLKAKELAEKKNLPLIEIDKSIYREKEGLEPLTDKEKEEVIKNIQKRMDSNPDLYATFQEKDDELLEEYSKKGEKYDTKDLCLKIYNDLRTSDHLLTDGELETYVSSISIDSFFKTQEQQDEINFTIKTTSK